MNTRACATALGLTAATTVLAFGGAAPASAGSSGMAAEFPVGTCIDYQNDHLNFDTEDIIYVTAVSCADPNRDYRVAQHAANVTQCDPRNTDFIYTTRDLVVLCVVNDRGPSRG